MTIKERAKELYYSLAGSGNIYLIEQALAAAIEEELRQITERIGKLQRYDLEVIEAEEYAAIVPDPDGDFIERDGAIKAVRGGA